LPLTLRNAAADSGSGLFGLPICFREDAPPWLIRPRLHQLTTGGYPAGHAKARYPITPMRALGVHSLAVTCKLCRQGSDPFDITWNEGWVGTDVLRFHRLENRHL